MLEVLLVDDEAAIRFSIGDALRRAGHNVTVAADGSDAIATLTRQSFDLVLTDVLMPKVGGIELFQHVQAHSPGTDVIIITAFGELEDAVAALKAGAVDYLTKPFDVDELIVRMHRLEERRALQGELHRARRALSERGESTIIGSSPPMLRLTQRLETVAASDVTVVITGESGTGKELVARTLHALSSRRHKPFVAVNCAAFPESLIEAELFGHERGAFTGAVRRREGRFKVADGGILFLDEIGEIPPMVQAKLLRVLQEGVIEPLGTDTGVKVDVRLVCATHRNLPELIAQGRFREDLYYRLNVLDLHVPPLRERRDDLPLLVEHFLRKFGKPEAQAPAISPRAWAALMQHAFPGNVRELEHAVRHAVVLAGGKEIQLEHLPAKLAGPVSEEVGVAAVSRTLNDAVRNFEREFVLRALSMSHGKRRMAAELLGISRKNLWQKVRAHAISPEEYEMAEGVEQN